MMYDNILITKLVTKLIIFSIIITAYYFTFIHGKDK